MTLIVPSLETVILIMFKKQYTILNYLGDPVVKTLGVDKEVSVSSPGRTNLETNFCFLNDSVPDSAHRVIVILVVQCIPYFEIRYT